MFRDGDFVGFCVVEFGFWRLRCAFTFRVLFGVSCFLVLLLGLVFFFLRGLLVAYGVCSVGLV